MVSVLIPSYNYIFFDLVKELHQQLIEEKIPFEIICMDDASIIKYAENEKVASLTNVSVAYLNKNIGRSAIRNLLASKAAYDWLLFLDADTMPVNSNFIKKYLSCLKNENKLDVVCGGLIYEENLPLDSNFLRWNFGKNREQKELKVRIGKPFNSFFSSSFLIKKSTFDKIKFNKNILLYGYEDVVFANDLKKNGCVIKHIDNPIYHLGLESNAEFLIKTKHALKGLLMLYQQDLLSPKEVKLLNTFLKVKKFYLDILLSIFYQLFGSFLEKKLTTAKSKLWLFDLFKITYLSYNARN